MCASARDCLPFVCLCINKLLLMVQKNLLAKISNTKNTHKYLLYSYSECARSHRFCLRTAISSEWWVYFQSSGEEWIESQRNNMTDLYVARDLFKSLESARIKVAARIDTLLCIEITILRVATRGAAIHACAFASTRSSLLTVCVDSMRLLTSSTSFKVKCTCIFAVAPDAHSNTRTRTHTSTRSHAAIHSYAFFFCSPQSLKWCTTEAAV